MGKENDKKLTDTEEITEAGLLEDKELEAVTGGAVGESAGVGKRVYRYYSGLAC